ncbi:MAG TPA: AsmA family protein [Terriglobales bacterium]|jgi:uncharacterized protein involved in outer membrane biogenesis|nr:AsmA family protein [Terriglobales bacterium]
MKKFLIVIAVLLVLGVVVALVLPSFLDVNRYHDQIQAQMQKHLGRPVTLGEMRLSLLPPSFRVFDASIGEDPAFSTGQPFAQAQELRVAPKLWPLLHGQIELSSLELRQPRIEIVRDRQGVWNFASLGQAAATPAPAAPSATPPPASAPPSQPEQPGQALSLANFTVTDGTVAITDLQKQQPRSVYDHIDFTVEGYQPGKAFSLDVAAHLPGQGAEKMELTGTIGPVLPNDYEHTPFEGSFKLDEVSLSGLQRFLSTAALAEIEGVASGKADVRNEKGRLTSSGSLTLEQAKVRGNDVGYTITADYDFTDDLDRDLLKIDKGNLRLGSTPIAVTGTIDAHGTPAIVDLQIKTAEVSIGEAARLAAVFGVAFNPRMKIDGRLQADLHAQGPLSSPILNGTIGGKELAISGGDLKQPVQVPDVTLALSPSDIRSNSFRATTGSTALTAQFALTHYSVPDASLDLALSTQNADLGEALAMARAYGFSAVEKYSGSGRLDVNLHLTGPLKGGAFTYNGTLAGRGLNLSGGGLKQPLQVPSIALSFTPQEIRSTAFQATSGGSTLSGQFTLTQYATPAAALDLILKTQNADLGEVLSLAHVYDVPAAEGLSGSGRVSLDLHAAGPLEGAAPFTYSGSGKLMNASLNMPAFTKPVRVGNADIQFARDSAVLTNLSAGMGQTNVSGTLTMRNFLAPQVQFNLAADKMVVSEWQQMVASGPPQRAAASGGFWSVAPRAFAAAPPQESILMRATGTGTLTVGTILYDQLVLNNVRSNVTLDHGIIRLAPLTADVCGGQETGSVVIDTHPNPSTYAVNLHMQKVDANQLLSSVSKLKQTLYGLLAANTNTTFSATSADNIARSLNGNLSLNLADGRINNMDVIYELAQQAKFLGIQRQKRPYTDLAKLAGDFDIHNGVATTQNLQAVISEGSFAATGSANLADQTLNMHVTAVLTKEFSDQVGGSQVGGYMSTALSNSKGELVIPVIVTGSFSNPHYSPDMEAIARMKLQEMVPTLSNPGKLSDILGSILGQKQQGQQGQGGQQQPQGQQQQNPLGQIIDVFGGKKQQGQQGGQPQPQGQQPQPQPQQQQQPTDPFSQIINAVTGGQKQQQQQKQKQKQQQQQQQQQQTPPPDQPPDQPK